MSGSETSEILARLDNIEQAIAFRPAWISGWSNLSRYLGLKDKQCRKAKAWAAAEGLYCKMINGTPSWAIADIDRAMRNGRDVECA